MNLYRQSNSQKPKGSISHRIICDPFDVMKYGFDSFLVPFKNSQTKWSFYQYGWIRLIMMMKEYVQNMYVLAENKISIKKRESCLYLPTIWCSHKDPN